MESGVFTADIGTSSLKAALIDERGRVLRFSRLFFPPQVRAVDWVCSFFSVWQQLTGNCSVQAICISGNGPTLVSVPEKKYGVQVRRAHLRQAAGITDSTEIIRAAESDLLFLWNEPAGSAVQAPNEKLKPSAKRGGGASLFLPRIAAFKQKYPRALAHAQYLFSGPEYLLYVLTGQAVTVLPDPRYESAYWNTAGLSSRRYASLQEGIPPFDRLLPPFVLAGTEIGRFCGIPVIAGVPDFIAALIGTGTLTAGTACDRAGSSEGLNICTADPCSAADTLMLPSIIPDLWNISFLLADSGASFSSFLTGYGFSAADYTRCIEIIATEPFRGVTEYPETFAGQGRRFIEQLAFRVRYGCEVLEQAAGIRPVYTFSGGQARNALWCQMKADMTGRTFALPHCADAELLGNAVLAFCALEKNESLPQQGKTATCARQLIRIERYYEPDSRLSARYTEKYSKPVRQRSYRTGLVF